MKECKTCKLDKALDQYKIHSSGKLRGVCHVCYLAKKRELSRPVSVDEQCCSACKDTKSHVDFDKCKTTNTGLFKICKQCRKTKSKESYARRSEKVKKDTLNYYYNNKPKVQEQRKKSAKVRLTTDSFHRVKRNLRNRLYYALKNTIWKKNTHFTKYIGCDRDTLINHIESQFQAGMTWDNYGKWHLDHRLPLASAKDEQQLYDLCHYTNLQPLWEKENKAKGDKLNYKVRAIDPKESYPFLLEIHYSKKIPTISYAFGLFLNDSLVGVVTYGIPASPPLRSGLAGEAHKGQVYELNRLCLKYNNKNEASMLVGRSLKLLPKNLFIVSFADTAQDHVGYVYQATNFGYYGLSANRKEWALKSNDKMHSMTIADQAKGQDNKVEFLKLKHGEDLYTRYRSRKHKYIYVTGNNKDLVSAILYNKQPYPKKDQ